MFDLPLGFVIAANGKIERERLVQRAKRTGVRVFTCPPVARCTPRAWVFTFEFKVHG
jgi:hypothetical protein